MTGQRAGHAVALLTLAQRWYNGGGLIPVQEDRFMHTNPCPTCGRETVPDAGCPTCGPMRGNGVSGPTPPPEVAGWKIEHASPDVLAWAAQTFDQAAFLAGKREIEQGGGHRFEDFIEEIERITNGGQ